MQRAAEAIGKLAVTAGLGVTALNSMIFNVDAGCRGVMFDKFRGVLPEVYDEGQFDFLDFFITKNFRHTHQDSIHPDSVYL